MYFNPALVVQRAQSSVYPTCGETCFRKSSSNLQGAIGTIRDTNKSTVAVTEIENIITANHISEVETVPLTPM